MADTSVIGLPEAIRGLRAELSEAMREGASEELRFKVGPVELEFVVEVSREAGATGGVKFWVLSLEAKGTAGRTATHRVKLALTPITTRRKDLEIRGRVVRRPA